MPSLVRGSLDATSLETPRLLLRRWRSDDLDGFAAINAQTTTTWSCSTTGPNHRLPACPPLASSGQERLPAVTCVI
ncbi:hypothetical protein GCE86_17615 [Micromonospora terminaliae]|uniref:GNAT family N-acetyltransferase n=1 Tax=Micromonospora terminaliae TaxID=1914461 RepID=A0ABX6E3S7_9ACTN|nr:hypothetical protein GCE86_17615 [Micromonospora terminaliae]